MAAPSPPGIPPGRLRRWLERSREPEAPLRGAKIRLSLLQTRLGSSASASALPNRLVFSNLWRMAHPGAAATAAPGAAAAAAPVFPVENIGQVIDSVRVFSSGGVRTQISVLVGGITDTLDGGPPTQAWLTVIVTG